MLLKRGFFICILLFFLFCLSSYTDPAFTFIVLNQISCTRHKRKVNTKYMDVSTKQKIKKKEHNFNAEKEIHFVI